MKNASQKAAAAAALAKASGHAKATGDKSAAQSQRVEAGIPFVEALARRMAATMPHSIDISDLVQEGVIGLIDAAQQNFTSTLGTHVLFQYPFERSADRNIEIG